MSKYYNVGLSNVGSYQVSGVPYTTGSNGQLHSNTEAKITFPYITKSITVINSGSAAGSALWVHFNPASDGHVTHANAHHYVTLGDTGATVTFNVKCKELYITSKGNAGYEVFAELTNIGTGSMYNLTGSGLTSVGPTSGSTNLI